MSKKIEAPYVLEFTLVFLPFPSLFLSLRLMSKRWNQAALKSLGALILYLEKKSDLVNSEITKIR